jgi:hypothetical protein
MKQQLVEDSTTDQLELEVWDHSVQVVPTAAVVSIIIDGSTDVSLATATISATGTCSYIPGAILLDELAENGVAVWRLTIGGEYKYFRDMFDIVLNPLYPAVTDEDLLAECAQLQDTRYMEAGSADSGSTVTLVSVLLKEYQDNHFQGGTLEITDGACKGQKQRISGNTRSTGTITVDTAFGSALTSTSRFIAKRTFQREISRAWDDVMGMIQTKGYRPALIMNSEDLRPVHLVWTLVKVCRNLAKTPDDIWWMRAKFYEEDFMKKAGQLKFIYDSDQNQWPESSKSFAPALRR